MPTILWITCSRGRIAELVVPTISREKTEHFPFLHTDIVKMRQASPMIRRKESNGHNMYLLTIDNYQIHTQMSRIQSLGPRHSLLCSQKKAVSLRETSSVRDTMASGADRADGT